MTKIKKNKNKIQTRNKRFGILLIAIYILLFFLDGIYLIYFYLFI